MTQGECPDPESVQVREISLSPVPCSWATSRHCHPNSVPIGEHRIAGAGRNGGLECVTGIRYVVYRQAPTPAASVSPIGPVWPAGNIHRLRNGRTRRHPAPARVWPNTPQAKDRWWRGKGPVRSTGFSRSRTLGRGRHIWSPELQGRGTTSGVLILRNGAPYGVLSLRIPDCRFAGRRCSCGFEDLGR